LKKKAQQNTASRKLNGDQKNEKSLNLQLQSTNACVLQKSYILISKLASPSRNRLLRFRKSRYLS